MNVYFAYRRATRMGAEEEEKGEGKISAYFEIEVPRKPKRHLRILNLKRRILKGDEKEFNEVLKFKKFHWFVVTPQEVGAIQFAENKDFVKVSSEDVKDVQEIVLFLSEDKEILEKWRELLERAREGQEVLPEEEFKKLAESNKILSIKVLFKEGEK